MGTEVTSGHPWKSGLRVGEPEVICTKNQKGGEQSGALGRALKDNTISRLGQEEEGSRTGEIHKSRLGIGDSGTPVNISRRELVRRR